MIYKVHAQFVVSGLTLLFTHSLCSAASQQEELHILVNAELSKIIYLFFKMVTNVLKLDLQTDVSTSNTSLNILMFFYVHDAYLTTLR